MWCYWSAKGGAGCSVVAAAMALRAAHPPRSEVLLVDLGGGDLATILGLDQPEMHLGHWLAAPNPPPDGLARLEVDAGEGLRLLAGPCHPLTVIGSGDRETEIAQAGDVGPPGGVDGLEGSDRLLLLSSLAPVARGTTLVTRLCYLAVRAALDHPVPDQVVVVAEPDRALRATDVAAALGVTDLAVLRWDPAVARAVDAGLLGVRMPRPLQRLPLPVAVAGQLSARGEP